MTSGLLKATEQAADVARGREADGLVVQDFILALGFVLNRTTCSSVLTGL